jgi:hypothetical protein
MVSVPDFDHEVYMLILDVVLYAVVPFILRVIGPVEYQLTFPPNGLSVQEIVLVLFATDCVAVQDSCSPLPSYVLVLTDPLNAI